MKFLLVSSLLLLLLSSAFHAQSGKADQSEKGYETNRQSSQKTDDVDLSTESELAVAAAYLNEVKSNFLNLRIYTLAGTDKSNISPEIAGSVITTGEEIIRFNRLAEKVLQYHKLTDICSNVLFKDDKPMVFTYKLRSVSFSTGALNLLSDDEVTALIAHEVGHVYVAKELMNARDNEDSRIARINELKCDAISLLTLKTFGIDPNVLTSALKKLISARKTLGLQTETAQSPAIEDREKLVKIFIGMNHNLNKSK